jgi:hypothetical protein
VIFIVIYVTRFVVHKALGFTQSLTEMSTRNVKIMFLGSKVRRVRRADNQPIV